MSQLENEVRILGEMAKKIADIYTTLRKSEKRIADYILQSPQVALHLSITELAKSLHLSEASVSRFCRTIGYDGFSEFKLALARDTFSGTISNIPIEIGQTDTLSTIADKTSKFFINVAKEMPGMLDQEHLGKAVSAIIKANKLQIYGIGGSGAIARTAHHSFLKVGISSFVYDDGYMQIVAASSLKEGDTAIGISHSGSTVDVVNAIRLARMNGATTIAITSNPQSPLAGQAEILLQTTSQEIPIYGEFLRARIGQLFIVDLLYIGVVFTLGDRARRSLETTARAIKEFY